MDALGIPSEAMDFFLKKKLKIEMEAQTINFRSTGGFYRDNSAVCTYKIVWTPKTKTWKLYIYEGHPYDDTYTYNYTEAETPNLLNLIRKW